MPLDSSSVTRTSGGYAIGGAIGAGLSLAGVLVGSLILGGNVHTDSTQNSTPSRLLDNYAYETFAQSTCTATGGLSTGAYDTCLLQTPFSSTASTRGLSTGTGVVKFTQLDIIANPSNAHISCGVVSALKTSTGGTLLITSASGTGTVATSATLATIGPTQYVKCGTYTTIGVSAAFSAKLRVVFSQSEVSHH